MDHLPIKLNLRSKEPLAKQLQARIRELIEQGHLLPGDPLPPVRDLAGQLQVNFNTIARAYRALDKAGWISTRQGRGTYVLDQALDESQQNLTPDEITGGDEIIQRIIHLCQHARRLGISQNQLHQIIDQQMREQKLPHRKARQRRTSANRKRLYSTLEWEPPRPNPQKTTKLKRHKIR